MQIRPHHAPALRGDSRVNNQQGHLWRTTRQTKLGRVCSRRLATRKARSTYAPLLASPPSEHEISPRPTPPRRNESNTKPSNGQSTIWKVIPQHPILVGTVPRTGSSDQGHRGWFAARTSLRSRAMARGLPHPPTVESLLGRAGEILGKKTGLLNNGLE